MENKEKIIYHLQQSMAGNELSLLPTPAKPVPTRDEIRTLLNPGIHITEDLFQKERREDIENELFCLENVLSDQLEEQRKEFLAWVLPKVEEQFAGTFLTDETIYYIENYILGWLMEFRNRSSFYLAELCKSKVKVSKNKITNTVDISLF